MPDLFASLFTDRRGRAVSPWQAAAWILAVGTFAATVQAEPEPKAPAIQAQSKPMPVRERPPEVPGRVAEEAEAAVDEADTAPEPSPLQSLLAEVNAGAEELADLRKLIEGGGEEHERLLLAQLEEVRTRFRRQLVAAAEQLRGETPLVGTPEDVVAVEARVSALLSAEGARIRNEMRRNREELLSRVGARQETTPAQRGEVEGENHDALVRATALLGEREANLTARSLLGQDVEKERGDFERSLTQGAKFASGALHRLATAIDELGDVQQEDVEKQAEREVLLQSRSLVAELQRKQLALLDAAGADTAQHRQDLIRTTGEVSGDILDAEVARGLLQTWRDDAFDWLKDRASLLAFNSASFVLILGLFWFLSRLCRWAMDRALQRMSGVSTLASAFAVKSSGRVVLLIGLVIAAAQVGIQVAPLLAGLGIAGFVVGFALQDTLSNFASGMMILMYRPFDVGDVIEAGGVMGTVKAMNLVTTAVITFDNQMLIVPNSKIWGDVIRNVTHQSSRRVDLKFGIGYRDDVDHAEQVLKDILDQHPMVLKEPEPLVRLHELGDSSVNFIVRPWVATAEYWNVYWDITREVKRRFDAEGISIPFPQRDVHVYEERLARRPTGERTASEVVPAPGAESSGAAE